MYHFDRPVSTSRRERAGALHSSFALVGKAKGDEGKFLRSPISFYNGAHAGVLLLLSSLRGCLGLMIAVLLHFNLLPWSWNLGWRIGRNTGMDAWGRIGASWNGRAGQVRCAYRQVVLQMKMKMAEPEAPRGFEGSRKEGGGGRKENDESGRPNSWIRRFILMA
jgi:hypothetical protein